MIASSRGAPEPRGDGGPPDEVRELDRLLGSVHFAARESFEPELLGRMRRGELPRGDRRSGERWALSAFAALSLSAAVLVAGLLQRARAAAAEVVVDRCCHDLDGGGDADDGIVIVAGPHEEVHRLSIYEDLDQSRSYTAADVIRFVRGAEPTVRGPFPGELITLRHCCVDFDGGGAADDGVLVVGAPPDHIVMAGIYDVRHRRPQDRPAEAGVEAQHWRLR